jgi:hypothetical protein
MSTPDERFAEIRRTLWGLPGVSSSEDDPGARKGFGSSGQLKIGGKIVAMLVRDRLVVKLPRARVGELVASRDGERFDPRHDGRLMKEWLVLDPASAQDWLSLAREAMAFVDPGG